MNWTNGKWRHSAWPDGKRVGVIGDQKVPQKYVKHQYKSTRLKNLAVERPKVAARAAIESDDDSKKRGVLLWKMTSTDSALIPQYKCDVKGRTCDLLDETQRVRIPTINHSIV